MEEKKSIKISLATILLIIAIVIILFMAYYIYYENKQISTLEANIATTKDEIVGIQPKLDTQLNSNSSENTIKDLTLGTYQITNYIENDGPYYGDAGVTITSNNLCSVYIGEGISFLGTYTIRDNKMTCNTLIKRGEEGGISYEEKNTVFEFEIISSDEIKIVNITPSALLSNQVFKDGTTYKLSSNSNIKVLLDNDTNQEETKFSNNEIKKALQNYLDLIGAKAGSPEGMLVKLGLCSYSDYINVNRTEDNYVKTNIKYSTYKEKMLQYVTEECFNSKFKDGYKEQDGILYFLDTGATGMSFEIKDIALKSETSSQEYTAQVYNVAIDGTKELNNIEFSIANNNGNCVISYCNY